MSDAPDELPPNLTVANRAAVYLRSGGFIAPLITVLVAFIAGGLVLDFTLAENLAMREYRRRPMSRFGLLSPKRMLRQARPLLEEYDVRGGDPETRAGSLSGGNQQKVVIARELSASPKVIIAAQPTRGLDVGAIEFVHRRLVEERDEGRGILLVSLELEEILSLSDRILVIYEGEIVGELPPTASEEQLGILMTGGGRSREVAA